MELKEMPDKATKKLSEFVTIRVEPELKRKFDYLGSIGKDAGEVVRILMRKAFEKVPGKQ